MIISMIGFAAASGSRDNDVFIFFITALIKTTETLNAFAC